MTFIEDFKQLNVTTAVLITVFFTAFIGPGFLTIYNFKPDLIVSLDAIKLIIFSISITIPGFFLLFFITAVSEVVLSQMSQLEEGRLGGYRDWFVLHGVSNVTIFYIALFVTYIFDLRINAFLWLLFVLFVLYSLFEIIRVVKISKNLAYKTTILKD